ncbi:MAG: hypothetical protein R2741_01445 [Methanolobus sp.]
MEAVKYVPEPYKTIYSSEYFVFLYESFLKLKRHKTLLKDEEIDIAAYEDLLLSIREKSEPSDRKRSLC